jgi:hypothetical protein
MIPVNDIHFNSINKANIINLTLKKLYFKSHLIDNSLVFIMQKSIFHEKKKKIFLLC